MPGYTRRQLKEDKFAEGAQGAMDWASQHRSAVVWTIGLVLVIAIALVGFLTWNARQTEQANLALSAAMRTFTAPLRQPTNPANETLKTFNSIAERGKEAEKEFRDVADKYSLTKPGKLAGYMAGVAAMQAGDNAGAEKQLKSAADSHDSDISALAKMALATFYRSTNRQSDAARIYKDVADHPSNTVSKPAAQLELAAMYEAADPKQAATIYEQIQKENPNTPAGQIAASRLAGKGGKAPGASGPGLSF